MSILERLKIIKQKQSGTINFRLQTIRFKKLLANANALLDLFEDGKEKIDGDYIFDRHYVTSLTDGMLEKLQMMVYDACILAPQNGEELYDQLDSHKHVAEKLMAQNFKPLLAADSEFQTVSGEIIAPEYQLLSSVLEWFDGNKMDITIKDFMRKTMMAGMQNMFTAEQLKEEMELDYEDSALMSGDIYLIDLWKDITAPFSKIDPPEGIDSVPFKHLILNTVNTDTPPVPHAHLKNTTWIAALCEDEVSLSSLAPAPGLRLDAVVSGHESSDYIFIFAENTFDASTILPPEFQIEKTDFGQFAWKIGGSVQAIEKNLAYIGRSLLSAAYGQQHLADTSHQ